MIYLFLSILGLIIGSFLNAVIYRLHSGDSIAKGHSKCPNCGHTLGAKDLVPLLSWLLLKGKCRYCQAKISWQYPLVELSTAILFVLGYLVLVEPVLGATYLTCLSFLYYLIATSFLIVIFVFDQKHGLILDIVSIPLIIIAIIFTFILQQDILTYLLAGLVGFAWFGWQYAISKGKWIGGGDLRLGLAMGLLLGWPKIIIALFMAYIVGAIVGVYLLATKKKNRQSQIPFGTFLSFATIIVWLWGGYLWQWYLGLFM
ncbi:MAG: prepilin peptidase [Candidatus Komeilibacteria bacterium]